MRMTRAELMIVLVSMLSCGCGTQHSIDHSGSNQEAPHAEVSVDAELAPYLSKFSIDIGVSTSGISASFQALTAPSVGQCVKYSNGDKSIVIDPTYWSIASLYAREEVVYHELGHCAMNLGHIDTVDANLCPVSIMYHATFANENCYSLKKSYYYAELRSHL